MPSDDYDVMIIGAGPVGLLLANLLGSSKLRTVLIEKEAAAPEQSMAIGITPPSLELLRQLDLEQEFIRQGVPVEHARVYENNRNIGGLHFHGLQHPYPFILSIPQSTTIKLLETRLADNSYISILRDTEFLSATQNTNQVTATIKRKTSVTGEQVRGAFLVGCDGHHSRVRETAAIAVTGSKNYAPHFAMTDIPDATPLGNEAHLFFSRHGSIESFPLPQQRRRWIVQLDDLTAPPSLELLVSCVRQQTGYHLDPAHCTALSTFSVQRFICQRYYNKRIILCGDAAHVMSPIGGQGMNTGFADAGFLATLLARHRHQGTPIDPLLRDYDQCRRRAFTIAANRAERGMWLGTRRGRPASILRFLLIKALLSPLYRASLPSYFAMLSIPYRAPHPNAGDSP